MSNTQVRRTGRLGAVLALTLVFGLVIGTLPASAAAAATARVNIHNVLAGQDGKEFQITVNNTEQALLGVSINEILITPPTDLIDAVSGVAPSGWTAQTRGTDPRFIQFKGGSLAPGAAATFTVVGDIRNNLGGDFGDTWLVSVSSDGGLTSRKANGTGEGLLTNVRVLQAQNVAVLSPAGAADDRDGDGTPEVTGTQSGVCLRTRVFNAANTSLNVIPGLSGSNANVGPARNVGAGNCTGAVLGGGSGSIGAGASRDFDFLVSFNNVGSRQISGLTATASSNGSSTPAPSDPDDDAFIATRNVAIEPKADLTYVPNSLFPRAVVPGATGVIFTLQIDKGPGQSPPLNSLGGDFQSTFANTNRKSPTSLPGGSVNDQTVEYNPTAIALIDDGRYDVTPRFSFTDANGLSQPLTALSAVEQVRLDSLIPEVVANIVPPMPQVMAMPPVQPAVTNGSPFDINGNVTDTDPTTGADAPCGSAPALPCVLEKAELIQYPLTVQQGGGTPLGATIDVTDQVTLNGGGALSGSITTSDFASGVQATRLRVTVEDEAGNFGTGQSALIDVDIIAPDISQVAASRGPTEGQRRVATVTFTEPVENGNLPLDWTVQDGENKGVLNVMQSADKQSATLTTALDFDADVPNGTATYSPVVGPPYHDRVGQELGETTEPLVDRIEPLAPVFDTVNGRTVQNDGKFYFNTPSVAITLANGAGGADDPSIKDRYEVEVYKESNGVEGLQRTGDTKICSDVAADFTIDLTCDFGPAEMEATVYALSIDVNANVGRVGQAQLVLDLTRPLFDLATIAGNQVTVKVSEALADGRYAANDWSFFALRSNGTRKKFQVGSVVAGPTADTVLVNIEDDEFTSDFEPHSVQYVFIGDEGGRLRDRAENELLDFTGEISLE